MNEIEKVEWQRQVERMSMLANKWTVRMPSPLSHLEFCHYIPLQRDSLQGARTGAAVDVEASPGQCAAEAGTEAHFRARATSNGPLQRPPPSAPLSDMLGCHSGRAFDVSPSRRRRCLILNLSEVWM